jgi:hypothetical protein
MAGNREILEFVIRESYTPATLPMARLAEYLSDLATILGEKDRVHFVELRDSSASIVHAVEYEAVPKVRARIHAARTGDADPEVLNARARIDHRLREDNAHGVLQPEGDEKGRLLYFPGAAANLSPEYGPFSEQGQLYGVPISVGGKKQLANVNLEDGDKTYFCEASRELAIQIAPLLFNHHIRVFGMGRYSRDADGNWMMRSFRISHFERLDSRPLAETVERLRGITRKVGLDKDIIAKLAKLREA